ncbi:MAG TPA: molybdate ABC transporter substrate-binding protein [Chryseolinea sp.]
MKKNSLALLFLILGNFALAQNNDQILIAAASDLKFALDSLVTVFKGAHPSAVVDVTYGSSGKLYEQISHSAPFDLFFSADIEYPLRLKKSGVTASDVYAYGVGRIVIWSLMDPKNDMATFLLKPSIRKIAIANPQHAPYGRRAEEALKYFDVYDRIKPKLVYGENISQTAQFVTAGAAEAGIIALSLALSPAMKKLNGHYYIIPENTHQPLEQGFVVLKSAENNSLANDFKNFMLGSAAATILSNFGFTKK